MKKILKAIIKSKVWFSISMVLIVLLLTVSLVVTQSPFIYNTICATKLGGESFRLVSGDPEQYKYFESDFGSKSEVLTAANDLNEQVAEEGMILLKNEDNFLPLKTPLSDSSVQNKPKISVFGKNSVNLVYGGSGSSGHSASGSATIADSLTEAGYEVNPTLTDFYKNNSVSGSGRPSSPEMGNILTGFPTGETPVSSYTSVRSSYADYNDAALIVISRIGGEGYDLPRSMFWNGSTYTNWSSTSVTPVTGARSVDDHYLQLDANETDLIKEVSQHFENIVIIVNCSQAMELGFLDDPAHYAYSSKIKSAVWIGGPGQSGIKALGRFLNGTISPSGRTVDTFARDFKTDPTWANFGNNLSMNGNTYTVDGKSKGYWFVDYEEGIYVGYRYWETRGFTEGDKIWTGSINGSTRTEWDSWYGAHVIYPLGYGLSYTTFDYKIENKEELSATQLTADSTVKVQVKVTNTGSVSGKEVVQIYLSAPYKSGKSTGAIEKSHVVLAGYAKTPVLYPVEEALADASGVKKSECTVTIDIPAYYFASYDYNDANGNGNSGYEIESGEYVLKACKNAHDTVDEVTFNQDDSLNITGDPVTENTVENRFDEVSEKITVYLSRSNWEGTFPTIPSDSDRDVTKEFLASMDYDGVDEGKPWYSDDMPEQSNRVIKTQDAEVKLYQLYGKPYNDLLWDKLLNQLTIGQMTELIGTGIYGTGSIDTIDKPKTISVDGPVGITAFMGASEVYDTCFYASGCVLAATYNVELAEAMGKMVANEALIGNERGDGTTYSCWYAPAVNIHRSPFGGRNWEYYSEDGLLAGSIASAVIGGAQSKGMATYIKHFALNDQETRRCDGVSTWANEQSMREIYLRAFEIPIKEAKSLGVMSSFNRIGTVWSGGEYKLLTEILREEWGFCGSVITDFNLYSHMPADQMIRAGGDLNLSQGKFPSATRTATQVTALRKATKNILYTLANSSAINGYGEGVKYVSVQPVWVTALIIIDVAIVVALSVWGVFAIRSTLKKMSCAENGSEDRESRTRENVGDKSQKV